MLQFGLLSKEAQEVRNENIKNISENNTRKTSR